MSFSGEDLLRDSSDYELGPLGFDSEGEDFDVSDLVMDQDDTALGLAWQQNL